MFTRCLDACGSPLSDLLPTSSSSASHPTSPPLLSSRSHPYPTQQGWTTGIPLEASMTASSLRPPPQPKTPSSSSSSSSPNSSSNASRSHPTNLSVSSSSSSRGSGSRGSGSSRQSTKWTVPGQREPREEEEEEEVEEEEGGEEEGGGLASSSSSSSSSSNGLVPPLRVPISGIDSSSSSVRISRSSSKGINPVT